jgi:hypothetical protein
MFTVAFEQKTAPERNQRPPCGMYRQVPASLSHDISPKNPA